MTVYISSALLALVDYSFSVYCPSVCTSLCMSLRELMACDVSLCMSLRELMASDMCLITEETHIQGVITVGVV